MEKGVQKVRQKDQHAIDGIWYGPVASWPREDLSDRPPPFHTRQDLSSTASTANWGRTTHPLVERRSSCPCRDWPPNWSEQGRCGPTTASFSGVGEPTGETRGQPSDGEIGLENAGCSVHQRFTAIAEVRQELSRADLVLVKLDAPSEDIFRLVNAD